MKALLVFIGAVALIVLSVMWYGYVLSIVWAWIIVPTFNAPTLSVPVAMGVASVARCIIPINSNDDSEKKPPSEALKSGMLKSFVAPLVTLVFCWIVKFWM